MDIMMILIPVSLLLAALGLAGFFWTMKSGQYEDLEGAAHRILFDEDNVAAAPPKKKLENK